MLQVLKIPVLLLAAVVPIHAGWVSTEGPEGGNISFLISEGKFLYAGISDGRQFRSKDLGSTWKPVDGKEKLGPKALQPASNRPPGTWQSGGFLFAAGAGRAEWRSYDEGKTYVRMDESAQPVEAPPGSDRVRYRGLTPGVLRSRDKGKTWEPVNRGGISTTVKDVLVEGGFTFISTELGVHRSGPGDTAWTLLRNGLPRMQYGSLASKKGRLFVAGGGAGVFRSSDQGGSWTRCNTGLVATYVADLGSAGTGVFAATRAGLFRMAGDGKSWSRSDEGIEGVEARSLHARGKRLYAGIRDDGIYRSEDGGRIWVRSGDGSGRAYWGGLGSHGPWLFADGRQLHRSRDEGLTWEKVEGLHGGSVFKRYQAHGAFLFAVTEQGILRSADSGRTWDQASKGLRPGSVYHGLVSLGPDLFAATSQGLYRGDGAKEWEHLYLPTGRASISALCSWEGRLIAGADGGVWISSDRARTWTRINDGLEGKRAIVLNVFDGTLYAGTAAAGVWRLPLADLPDRPEAYSSPRLEH